MKFVENYRDAIEELIKKIKIQNVLIMLVG